MRCVDVWLTSTSILYSDARDQAYETSLQVVTPLRTGSDDSMMTGLLARYARVLLVSHRFVGAERGCPKSPAADWVDRPGAAMVDADSARDALTAIRPKLDKSALLHWIAIWILLAIEDQVRGVSLFCGLVAWLHR